MTVKNAEGMEVEIEFYGDVDDIQVDEAYYTDGSMPPDVSEEDIAYIMDRYASEIEESILQKHIACAESMDMER